MAPPAPPRDCALCGRRIGARAIHYVALNTNPPAVLCGKCLVSAAHAHLYPWCPRTWHDMHDHPLALATRAAAAHLTANHPEEVK